MIPASEEEARIEPTSTTVFGQIEMIFSKTQLFSVERLSYQSTCSTKSIQHEYKPHQTSQVRHVDMRKKLLIHMPVLTIR